MTTHRKTCPACNSELELPPEAHGRKARCPDCDCKFIIGTDQILEQPTKSISRPQSRPQSRLKSRPKSRPKSHQKPRPSAPLPKRRNYVPAIVILLILGGTALIFHRQIRSFAVKKNPLKSLSSFLSIKENTPKFITTGTVTGINIITEKTPVKIQPDTYITTLLSKGAQAFKSKIELNLQKWLSGKSSRTELSNGITQPEDLLQLSRYELIRVVETKTIDEILARREGKDFMTRFLSNQDWLDDFLITGPFGKGRAAVALHGLCSIYRYDKECTLPLYRKLACAYVHDFRGKWEDDTFHYRLLDRFQAHKRGHKLGRMHGSFDRMESWEMRYITSTDRMGDSRSIKYMQNQLNYPRNSYYGACWSISYRLYNHLGYSIHRPQYYLPWQNEWVGEPLKHRVGGVCGTLSNYGAFLARAHGVPGFAVGQPGHCAYMIRTSDEGWGTAYSVTGNTQAGSFFGGGNESIVRLMQAVYSNAKRTQLLKATHYNWEAHFIQDQNKTFTKGEKLARTLSIEAAPLHLNHWKQLAARMAVPSSNTTIAEWKSTSIRFMKALGHWQRPCWETISNTFLSPLKKISQKDRVQIVTAWHKALPKKGPIHRIGGRLTGHLNAQTSALKNPQDIAKLFTTLLQTHAKTQDLPMIISWGKSRLGTNPKTAKLFLKHLNSFCKSNKKVAKGFAHILGDIVIQAEKNGDFETFATTSKLANQLFPDQDKKFNHMHKKDLLAKMPKTTMKFPGQLLSAKAIPMIQYPYDSYTPLSHFYALQPNNVGFLITKKQKEPEIIIRLPGRCKLTGIMFMPRFEHNQTIKDTLPLKISSSLDGKKWSDIKTITEVRKIYEINLTKLAREGSYLRFKRTDKEKHDYLQIRAIRIYGIPQY